MNCAAATATRRTPRGVQLVSMVIGDEAVALIRNPDNSRPEPSLMLEHPSSVRCRACRRRTAWLRHPPDMSVSDPLSTV